MQDPIAQQAPHAPPQTPRKLDTVVKLGLGVFVGSFVLISVGMFLSRPDRSIPPYSVGSQEGTAVATCRPGPAMLGSRASSIDSGKWAARHGISAR